MKKYLDFFAPNSVDRRCPNLSHATFTHLRKYKGCLMEGNFVLGMDVRQQEGEY
jgi:hypothetical protein